MDAININNIINQLSEIGTEKFNDLIVANQTKAIINLIIFLAFSLILIIISVVAYHFDFDVIAALLFVIIVVTNIFCLPFLIKDIYMWYTHPDAQILEMILKNI